MNGTVTQPNYGFEVTESRDEIEFNVSPPALDSSGKLTLLFFNFGFAVMIMSSALVVGGLFAAFFSSSLLFIVFLLVGAVLSYLNAREQRGKIKSMLSPVTMRVSNQGISVNQKQYLREHIGEFWVQFGKERHQEHKVDVMSEVTPAGQLGIAMANNLNRRMYSVQMRYAAEDVALVQGLPPGTATTLLEKLFDAYRSKA